MRASRKAGLVMLLVIAMGIFGYSQYASASQIDIDIVRSDLLAETEAGSQYDIELQFQNPSLLLLAGGDTEFYVMADDEVVGKGQLEPFTLQPLDSSLVGGTFETDGGLGEGSSVKITGVTKYDVLVTSIDVPFVYYPTQEQTSEFIRQG